VTFIALPGLLLVIAGLFQFLAGLAAVLDSGFYAQTPHYAFRLDPTAWGWLHMGIGAAVITAGLGLAKGNRIARIVACGAAFASALSNFFFVPYDGIWSVLIISFDMFVLWAIIAPTAANLGD
jgi:hypothetical protein